MKRLIFILSIFIFTAVACNSDKHTDETANTEAEGKKPCCKDGDKKDCDKSSEKKACCTEAEAAGKTCDKCANTVKEEKACCKEAEEKGEKCAKCAA